MSSSGGCPHALLCCTMAAKMTARSCVTGSCLQVHLMAQHFALLCCTMATKDDRQKLRNRLMPTGISRSTASAAIPKHVVKVFQAALLVCTCAVKTIAISCATGSCLQVTSRGTASTAILKHIAEPNQAVSLCTCAATMTVLSCATGSCLQIRRMAQQQHALWHSSSTLMLCFAGKCARDTAQGHSQAALLVGS